MSDDVFKRRLHDFHAREEANHKPAYPIFLPDVSQFTTVGVNEGEQIFKVQDMRHSLRVH
jgi:hypothetical protein